MKQSFKVHSGFFFFSFFNQSLVTNSLFYHFDFDLKSLKWNLQGKIFVRILRRQDSIMKTSCLFDKYIYETNL